MESEPTKKRATHDIVLERLDNGAEIGFTLSDGEGKRNPFAISRSPYPRMSLQTYQGAAGYDNQEPPYRTLIQQDWTGGRGQLNFEDDSTRFFDSNGLHTEIGGKMFLGGNPQFSSGYLASLTQSPPTSVKWVKLLSDTTYLAKQFTATANTVDTRVMLWVRCVGTPGNLTIGLQTNSGGEPGGGGADVDLAPTAIPRDHAVLYPFLINSQLTGSTIYHITATAASSDVTDYWEVGVQSGGSDADKSSNGSTWSATTDALWYVLWSEAAAGNQRDMIPFVYKNQLYAVQRFEDKANSFLYMAGDRGAADDNSGDLTLLNDASKSWTTNAYAGYTVLITAGPGSEEEQPWRTISSNTSTALTCDSDWKITHTTSTEYVILSDAFTSMLDLGGHVTDIALAGDFIYFARGEGTNILRYQAYNNSGTWVTRNDAENTAATYLLAQRQPDGDEYLWLGKNEDASLGTHVRRLNVPQGWGDLYQIKRTLAATDELWTDYVQPSVTATLASPDISKFATNLGTTGLVASKNLDAPVDCRQATRVGTHVRITGTVPTVTIGLSDTRVEDQKFQPSKVMRATRDYKLPAALLEVAVAKSPTGMKHYNGTSTWYNLANAGNGDVEYSTSFVIADTNDELYIGSDKHFSSIRWFLSDVNATGSRTVTAKIWDGDGWVDVSITDGTSTSTTLDTSGGAMTFTLANFSKWQPGSSDDGTNLDTSLYWMQLTFSGALDEVIADNILLSNSLRPYEDTATLSIPQAIDADDGTFGLMKSFRVGDWLYVIGVDPFDEVKFDFKTVNATTSCTLLAEYFNGEEFVAATNVTDGTDAGSTTIFGQDGSITFNLPDDMSLITINGTEGYCVRFGYTHESSTALTDPIEVYEVAVRNRRLHSYYELVTAPIGNRSTAATANEDGDVPVLDSGDYLYICGANRFDLISFVIDGTINNGQTAILTGYHYDGENWTQFSSASDGTVSSGASLAQDGDFSFSTGTDLMQRSTIDGTTGYWVRLQASAAMDAALIHGVSLQRKNEITITLAGPTVSAGLWYYLDGAISLFAAASTKGIDLSSIQSVNLSVTTALPTAIEIRGGVALVNQDGFFINGFGPNSDRITGMELYGQGRQNPWIFTEGGVYEIQTQNGNDVAPIPLRELSTLRSPLNGRASTTNDTYLYFNIGAHVQRYFNQTLDNVGWNREEGMPANRNGYPAWLLSAPGGVYAGLDAGDSGWSSVMIGQSRAWHTLFIAPYGMRVRQGAIQTVPGSALDRLWVSVGPLLLWLPIPSETFDPTRDSNYEYLPEGSLITSWMSAGLYTIKKLWKAISLFAENLTSNVTVHVGYQLENGDWDGVWTNITEDFDESPVEEHDLKSLMVTARRLRLRIALRTNAEGTTPIVYAYGTDTLIRFPTKFSYTFQHHVRNQRDNLAGVPERGLVATAWVDVLDDLANSLVPLKAHSKTFPELDGKIVVVEPSGMRAIPSSGEKSYLLETTLLEV